MSLMTCSQSRFAQPLEIWSRWVLDKILFYLTKVVEWATEGTGPVVFWVEEDPVKVLDQRLTLSYLDRGVPISGNPVICDKKPVRDASFFFFVLS